MRRLMIIAGALLAVGQVLSQHNDFQSMYMYDALTINPAYAGNKGALVVNANYRDQWSGLNGSPKTLAFTSHLLSRSRRVGLGLVVVNDRFGIVNDTKINAVYAYKIRMKKNELSLGLAGGIRSRSVDLDALNLKSPDDAAFMGQTWNGLVPDVTFGAHFKSSRVLTGVSIPNLVRLKDPSTYQAMNGYFSVLLDIGRESKLKPSVLVKYLVHSPVTYEGNLTLYYRQLLSFGAGIRDNLTTNVHLRLQLNRQFAVAYLYERNFGSLGRFLVNTHEFMVNYTFDYQTNVQSPRYL
jgi:type IX secretion system PorP/SprF family membrane protein